jgi:hypothetical protein
MRTVLRSLILVNICVCLSLHAQDSTIKRTAVTVYNSNIAIIKETRNLDLPKGSAIANLVNVAQLIDPTTVRIKFDGQVLEQNYQYDLVSLDKVLSRYIEKNIQLVNDKGEFIEGSLLSVYGNQIVLKKADGGLTLLPDISKYRLAVGELPQGLITRPTLQCLLDSRHAGKQDMEVSYQTGGVSWHAEYVAILDKDDKQIDLNSWVSIQNNSGTTFKDASLKVVAGDVNRVVPRTVNRQVDYLKSMSVASAEAQFSEKALFEYHAYELQRKTTLANNETKQVELFEKNNINVQKKFSYHATETSGDTEDKVDVILLFENNENNNIGVPMPAGTVRIFKEDRASLEFIGEDALDHTPVGAKVKLQLGKAFDITAKTKLMNRTSVSKNVEELTYLITVKNHKSEATAVDVRMNLWGDWSITTTTDEYTKEDASTVLFHVTIPARSEKAVQFTARIKP